MSTGSETYKFTGKPYSSSIGSYYDYHRWYDPSIGRFVSVDPKPGRLSNPQSMNPYIYVTDLPTQLIDPTGEDGGFGLDNREKLYRRSRILLCLGLSSSELSPLFH